MKAEERHRLKTNELAQTLSELPQYLKEHGNQILIAAIALIVVLVGGIWWFTARYQAKLERMIMLNTLLGERDILQSSAAQKAQIEAQPGREQTTQPSYDGLTLASSLGQLSAEAGPGPVGLTALLQQAQTLRSQMFFSDQPLSPDQKNHLLNQVVDIYNRVLSEYPTVSYALGQAQIGLALVAEDQQDWNLARQKYQQIINDDSAKLSGTIYPILAQRRLNLLNDISQPIAFPLAAPDEDKQTSSSVPIDGAS